MTLSDYLSELASAAPAPGGGSAAALAGALGASLVAMVSRLTIGRKNYADVSPQFEAILPRADALRDELIGLMQEDSAAYAGVMEAYRMPKETDDEKETRERAIQESLIYASEIPLRVAQACAEILMQSELAAEQGNKNAASDGGAGALMAEAGLQAALLNVRINLGLIKDETYVAEMRAQLEPLVHIAEKRQSILETVQTRL